MKRAATQTSPRPTGGRTNGSSAIARNGAGAKSATPQKGTSEHQSLSKYIQARFDECSRSQKDVAQYIVDHLDEAAFQTAEELARRASTSSSTVAEERRNHRLTLYDLVEHLIIEPISTAARIGSIVVTR